jgi:hypothetical protein
MNVPPQPSERQEAQLQEADLEPLNDTSLPAEQVIAEQSEAAGESLAPRFIP